MPHEVAVFDPHVINAIQALTVALIVLLVMKFKEFVRKQADKR